MEEGELQGGVVWEQENSIVERHGSRRTPEWSSTGAGELQGGVAWEQENSMVE